MESSHLCQTFGATESFFMKSLHSDRSHSRREKNVKLLRRPEAACINRIPPTYYPLGYCDNTLYGNPYVLISSENGQGSYNRECTSTSISVVNWSFLEKLKIIFFVFSTFNIICFSLVQSLIILILGQSLHH